MQAGVIKNPLHDNKFLFEVFFGDGMELKFEIGPKVGKYFLINTLRMQNLELVG